MASSDDEDLKRAIALSLHGGEPDRELDSNISNAGQSAGNAINLDSDDGEATTDDDETTDGELKLQMKAETGNANDANGHLPTSKFANTLAFLGTDRKRMEEDRLARRKRKASTPSPPARKSAKTTANNHVELLSLDKRNSANPTSRALADIQGTEKVEKPLDSLFMRGTVKKTWAFGYPRIGDDIKLEEILLKNDLSLAVLSSFQWDMDWLLAKIDLRKTQITLVMQAKDDATKQQYRRETGRISNLHLCFPSMDGQVNYMHSKLMLLSYSTHLRVAVPTANLVSYDWGESGGIMENSVFLIDLPRLTGGSIAPEDMTYFGKELIYFCEAMGLERSIIQSIYTFDFSATMDLAFVHTIGGVHLEDSWRRTGYCGLGRAVQELGLATDQPLNVDFVTSSVGSLNMDFLAMLYLASQGDDGSTEYEWRNPPAGRTKDAKAALQKREASRKGLEADIRANFHVYFPTSDTVRNSKAGAAGTICFQSKWYNSPTFPRQVLRDCKSTRLGMLMHNKILYVRRANINALGSASPESRSWAYVGSANCSESAWGKLSKDRATKLPKLNCRNWECGVIVPVRHEGVVGEPKAMKEFEGIVPVSIQHPGEPYGNRKPWYNLEQ